MHTSLLHHLVKTINTKMKIIREQVREFDTCEL